MLDSKGLVLIKEETKQKDPHSVEAQGLAAKQMDAVRQLQSENSSIVRPGQTSSEDTQALLIGVGQDGQEPIKVDDTEK
jgi:hypothetical protein